MAYQEQQKYRLKKRVKAGGKVVYQVIFPTSDGYEVSRYTGYSTVEEAQRLIHVFLKRHPGVKCLGDYLRRNPYSFSSFLEEYTMDRTLEVTSVESNEISSVYTGKHFSIGINNKKNEVVVFLGTDPMLSVEDCAVKIIEAMTEKEKEQDDLTVGLFAKDWYLLKKGRIAKGDSVKGLGKNMNLSTIRDRRTLLKEYCLPALDKVPMASITTEDLRELLEGLRIDNALTIKETNEIWKILYAVFSKAKAQHLIRENPMLEVPVYHEKKRPVIRLDQKDLLAIFSKDSFAKVWKSNHAAYSICLTSILTGISLTKLNTSIIDDFLPKDSPSIRQKDKSPFYIIEKDLFDYLWFVFRNSGRRGNRLYAFSRNGEIPVSTASVYRYWRSAVGSILHERGIQIEDIEVQNPCKYYGHGFDGSPILNQWLYEDGVRREIQTGYRQAFLQGDKLPLPKQPKNDEGK